MQNNAAKPKIKYVHGDETILDQIKALWTGLNEHHLLLSPYFKQHYNTFTFEQRKAALQKKAKQAKIRVDLAVDKETNQNVGYIVCTLNKEKTGEIDSLFVSPAFRGLGVGDELIKKALAWLDKKGAVEKIVSVGVGNEQAFGFYSRYGFYPKNTMLKQIKES